MERGVVIVRVSARVVVVVVSLSARASLSPCACTRVVAVCGNVKWSDASVGESDTSSSPCLPARRYRRVRARASLSPCACTRVVAVCGNVKWSDASVGETACKNTAKHALGIVRRVVGDRAKMPEDASSSGRSRRSRGNAPLLLHV
jgi:hypothetical protein